MKVLSCELNRRTLKVNRAYEGIVEIAELSAEQIACISEGFCPHHDHHLLVSPNGWAYCPVPLWEEVANGQRRSSKWLSAYRLES